MSIFGQVWLWSAAAFVVGVLLTWLFLARPAQARSRHLERRLLAVQSAPAAHPARVERDPEPVSAPVARKRPVAASAPAQAEEHHVAPSWLERDSLAGRSPGYQPGSEIDDDSLFDPEPEPEPEYRGESAGEATTVFHAFGRDTAERGALFGNDEGPRVERDDEAGATYGREPIAGAGREAGSEAAEAPFGQDDAAGSGYGRERLAGIGREELDPGHGSLLGSGEAGAGYGRESEAGRGALFGEDDAGRGAPFGQDDAATAGYGSEQAPGSLFGQGDAGSAYGREGSDAGHGSLFGRDAAGHGRHESEQAPGSLFAQGDAGSAYGGADAEYGGRSLFERDQAAQSAGPGSLFDRTESPTPTAGRGSVFERDQAESAGLGSGRDAEPEPGSLFDPDHTPETARTQEAGSAFAPFAASEPPPYAFGGEEPEQPADEDAGTETTQLLPRRQPRRSAQAFDPPRPSMRTVERREPVRPEEGGRSGSLFEPGPRAANVPTSAPARGQSPSVPPGPFGPGSAMPRPGGGKPSEEFTVKASVTALRYCGEDSSQYARMVAEVWFRSAEDAERVGFRPL